MEVTLGFKFEDVVREGLVKKTDVDEIIDWLRCENLPVFSHERVAQFLISCEGDCDDVKTTIRAYVKTTNGSDEVFSNRDVNRPDLDRYLKISHICTLPKRTRNGYVILFTRLIDYNYEKFEMGSYVTVLSMAIESAIFDHPAKGLIVVYDSFGVTWKHMFCLRYGLLRTFSQYLQEAVPVKLHKICLLNVNSIVLRLLATIRPFVRKEVMNKVEAYSAADIGVFFKKCVPKRFFPADYGGNMPEFKILHEQQVEKFKALALYFANEERLRKSRIL